MRKIDCIGKPQTDAWLDEDSCKALFNKLVRCWGFIDYKIISCGDTGYRIIMIRQDPSVAFKECVLMSQDDMRHDIQVLRLSCLFSSLYKTLVTKLIDLEKKCWKMTLFYFSSSFNSMPSASSTTMKKYVAHAGEFVGCEAAIAIDMMPGAMQEK